MGYIETGRDLRRMEANTRSPIFSEFAELLEGIVTVRAFSAERRFLDNLHMKIDITTKVRNLSFMCFFCPRPLNYDVLDVVFFLDDQQMVAFELRCTRRNCRADYYLVFNHDHEWQSWHSWSLHYDFYEFHLGGCAFNV